MSFPQTHQAAFRLPEGAAGQTCLKILGEAFHLAQGPAVRRKTTWYETFDWRLYRAGLRLLQEHDDNPSLTLSEASGRQLYSGPANFEPTFADSLPEGPLQETLAPTLSMRRLLPFATLDHQGQELRVLDGEEKTVVRLRIEEGEVSPGDSSPARPLPKTLHVRSVRGYDRSLHHLTEYLEKELQLERLAEDELERAAHALGRHPGDYSSKVQIELDPASPAGDATRHIHLTLLAALRRNEEGTRADLDSEFLHDFRVAVRRTRSALTQIKGVFPAAVLEHFKREFSWLGRLTGPTRDLDVYLLKIDDYRDALPPEIRGDLEPLGRLLVSEQRREQRKLAKALGSNRYRRLLVDWQRFLEEDIPPPGVSTEEESPPQAQQPISVVASARIWKTWRRVVKRGEVIREETPAEAVHEVRIDCKKLRYLLEFFKGLYPPQEIGLIIKALKRLQDNLGDFNDYEVQQKSMADFADRLLEMGEADAGTFLAMGRLQTQLAEGQAEERHRFGKEFARFAAPENRQRFRALFKP